jgi:hypothetical protein
MSRNMYVCRIAEPEIWVECQLGEGKFYFGSKCNIWCFIPPPCHILQCFLFHSAGSWLGQVRSGQVTLLMESETILKFTLICPEIFINYLGYYTKLKACST